MALAPLRFQKRCVYCNDDTTALFFVYSGAMSINGVNYVRPWVEVEAISSTDLDIEVFYQTSDDGASWNTAVQLGTMSATTNGLHINSGTPVFVGLASALEDYVYWRVGIKCLNSSTAALQLAYVAMGLDFKD